MLLAALARRVQSMRTRMRLLLAVSLVAALLLAPRRPRRSHSRVPGRQLDGPSSGALLQSSSSGAGSGPGAAAAGRAAAHRQPTGCRTCRATSTPALAGQLPECHGATPAYGATMPLVTWNDLHAAASAGGSSVYQLVETRIHDDAQLMPPTPYAPLDRGRDHDRPGVGLLAGALASRETCSTPADSGAPVVDSLPCTPDTLIRPASPYAMADSGEQYVCYGFRVVTVTAKCRSSPWPAHRQHVEDPPPHPCSSNRTSRVSSTPTACSGAGGLHRRGRSSRWWASAAAGT